MDIRKVRKLIECLAEADVSEIETRAGAESARISRTYTGAAVSVPQQFYAQPAPVAAAPAAAPSAANTASAVEATAPMYKGEPVKSPMVGTFYRSPAPGARPFVEVGQQ